MRMILDADSLMEGETMVEMVRRMEATPTLACCKPCRRVIRAKSRFGRIMQFGRLLFARLRPWPCHDAGAHRPLLGPQRHRPRPRLRRKLRPAGTAGKPPFGGHILSHDYVEAALLARAGWTRPGR
jgi:membrane glycosyltransferase